MGSAAGANIRAVHPRVVSPGDLVAVNRRWPAARHEGTLPYGRPGHLGGNNAEEEHAEDKGVLGAAHRAGPDRAEAGHAPLAAG